MSNVKNYDGDEGEKQRRGVKWEVEGYHRGGWQRPHLKETRE